MPTRTAAQKRAQAKGDYDAFLARCPSRQLLARISDKWVALILAALGNDGPHRARDDGAPGPRPMRYSELSRRLSGISQKMLTQTLRQMERDGLVVRTVHPVVPPRVEYRLTDLGRTLSEAFCGVWTWAEANLERIETARAAFDARPR